jgi:hypothetical protein
MRVCLGAVSTEVRQLERQPAPLFAAGFLPQCSAGEIRSFQLGDRFSKSIAGPAETRRRRCSLKETLLFLEAVSPEQSASIEAGFCAPASAASTAPWEIVRSRRVGHRCAMVLRNHARSPVRRRARKADKCPAAAPVCPAAAAE